MDTNVYGVKPAHGIRLESIGQRLRAERQRLGLSQQAFADKLGVHRQTQKNYELDKRAPPTPYLDAALALGVDTWYVMSGVPQEDIDLMESAHGAALFALLGELGYPPDEAANIFLALKAIWSKRREVPAPAWQEKIQALVHEAPVIARIVDQKAELDCDLLSQVLVLVDLEAAQRGMKDSMSPKRRAAFASRIYRSSKALGKVDAQLLVDLFALSFDIS